MKIFSVLKNGPNDKNAFKHALAETNTRRSLSVIIVVLFFAVLMFFSQLQSMLYNADLELRERSELMFDYAKVWMGVAIICLILYLFARRKKASDRFRIIASNIFSLLLLALGASIGIVTYLADGEPFFSLYIVFTLFASLIFLMRPLISALSLSLVGIASIYVYKLAPGLYGLEPMDELSWLFTLETILCATVLAFVVSLVLYKNFLDDFNKTYIIEQLNEELSWYIKIDVLTEIFNRKEFSTQVVEKTAEMAKKDAWVTIAMADIDYFKNYNDTYGHLEGDKCLKKVAQSLQKSICEIAPNAIVARYGGEEFTAAIFDMEPDEALAVFEKAFVGIQDMNIEHVNSKVCPYVTISMGVFSIKPAEGYDVSEALNQADKLMYKAKESGRNKIIGRKFYE